MVLKKFGYINTEFVADMQKQVLKKIQPLFEVLIECNCTVDNLRKFKIY